ncbi:MAG: hypothetical protein AAF446_04725 [Pseudomonadota bacterium]
MLAETGLQWRIEADRLEVYGIEIDRTSASHRMTDHKSGHALHFHVEGLHHSLIGPAGEVVLSCSSTHWSECRTASVLWQRPNGMSQSGQLRLRDAELTLDLQPMHAVWALGAAVPTLKIKEFPVAWLANDSAWLQELIGLSGSVDLDLRLGEPDWRFSGGLSALSFDTSDGQVAAAELGLDFKGHWYPLERDVDLVLHWDQGEALFGPLYIPPPELPFELHLKTNLSAADQPLAAKIELAQSDQLRLQAAIQWPSHNDIAIQNLAASIQVQAMQLASMWRQGLESLAESYGLAGLQPAGNVQAQVQIHAGQVQQAKLQFENVQIDDERERIRLENVNGALDLRTDIGALELDLSWQDALLMGLDLGPSELMLDSNESGVIELVNPPFRQPLLDGHLVVHQLQWIDWLSETPSFVLHAELEPIQLASVSRAFGWPLLGGELSGYLPGMHYNQGVLEFDGGISASIFSGALQISNLAVERPFGPLPALAADIEFSQFDLFELTGAFDFGSMQGRLNGYMRDLRLLDWQPVAFDAWLATDPETSDKRRISQQAIDSISSLSGAGGAVLSNTVLRVFEDFPYANVGLGCTLSEGICQMRGLNEQENGGYLIVEGRGLPHLDIIGYQRRVNWTRLLNQIQSATRGGVSIGQPGSN